MALVIRQSRLATRSTEQGKELAVADLILHHYDFSNYAEKVRLALGYKGLGWRSVIIPPIAPKPELMPLTGGYRRTPVLQIGADIFCDTRQILRELERRQPEPTLYPAATWPRRTPSPSGPRPNCSGRSRSMSRPRIWMCCPKVCRPIER